MMYFLCLLCAFALRTFDKKRGTEATMNAQHLRSLYEHLQSMQSSWALVSYDGKNFDSAYELLTYLARSRAGVRLTAKSQLDRSTVSLYIASEGEHLVLFDALHYHSPAKAVKADSLVNVVTLAEVMFNFQLDGLDFVEPANGMATQRAAA